MILKQIKTFAIAAALGATLVSGSAMAVAGATANVSKDSATELMITWSGYVESFSSAVQNISLKNWSISTYMFEMFPIDEEESVWINQVQVRHAVAPHDGELAQGSVFKVTLAGPLGASSSFSKMSPHDGGSGVSPADLSSPHWDHFSYSVATNMDGKGTATLYALHPVPEPESYAMMLVGLGLMGTIARRRSKSKAS